MRSQNVVFYLFLTSLVLLLFVIYTYHSNVTKLDKLSTLKVPKKYLKQCKAGSYYSQVNTSCLPCEAGTFSFDGWIGCHPWLNCFDIEASVRTRGLLSTASHYNAVKHIYLADWHGFKIVYVKCASRMFWDDCEHNAKMVRGFQQSKLIVQLLGYCDEKQEIITRHYKYGSADKLNVVLAHQDFPHDEELHIRLQLAGDYLRILKFLHNSPLGVRVMCDANDLIKLLSQFLITDDFHLVVNDLDALPKVDHTLNEFVKCGHRELNGWFVAPEQLWPFEDAPFDDSKMPPYDEKVDIWRIPDVLVWFLGDTLEALKIKAKLKDVFTSCKSYNPRLRPSAGKVLEIFQEIIK